MGLGNLDSTFTSIYMVPEKINLIILVNQQVSFEHLYYEKHLEDRKRSEL